MQIEKTMIIPLALCVFVVLTAGIVIARQHRMMDEHLAIDRHIAGMLKECRVPSSE